MRYIIKGGVWKNSDDEILKAAVMKYGLNQWSRVSSLLVRKSAKQCKARWYEWLDPSIKKTEWTREEEEKLLHLAKIFPCQWRTIAPIVGRTPAQCIERYERLLDQAQGKDELDESDPRKLKPGEIDPNPENKPARPDPIDMDDDEKEMLAEARVRLANTKGKKAKRKAREKMIEEARRLAGIQKKRELRAAGIGVDTKFKKKKGVDYNSEILFERRPDQIVYQTGTEEDPKPNLQLGNITIQALEGKRRDDEEEKLRKKDEQKMKKLRERDYTKAVSVVNKMNNALENQKTKLIMPTPQLQDSELEEMGKLNESITKEDGTDISTKILVGDYAQRAITPTPMRTPRLQNSIMKEAQNNIALLRTETPLAGGENPELQGTGRLNSILPNKIAPQTPNLNAFAAPNPKAAAQTPRLATQQIYRGETPRHDQLKINDEVFDQNWESGSQSGMSTSNMSVAQSEKVRAMNLRESLKERLSALPKPQHDYQIELPDEGSIEPEITKKRLLDAEDQDKIRAQEEFERQQRLQKLISQTVRKQLPRPFKVNYKYGRDFIGDEESENQEAEELIANEMIEMITKDSVQYPFKGSIPAKDEPEMDFFDENELENAHQILLAETQIVKIERGVETEKIQAEFNQNCGLGSRKVVYDQSLSQFVINNEKHDESLIEYKKRVAELCMERIEKENKRIDSLQKKVNLLLGGYPKRAAKIEQGFNDIHTKINNGVIEENVFRYMQDKEKEAINSRISDMQAFYEKLVQKESDLQKRHAFLLREREEAIVEESTIIITQKQN